MMENYWSIEGSNKTFYCPFNLELFRDIVPLDAHILDYGTGYGRVLQILEGAGYSNLTGVDASPEMIRRASFNLPNITFKHVKSSEVPFPNQSVDAIILYSVLSSVLSLKDQQQLITALTCALKPGGVIYLHDFLVQPTDDERYRSGYELGQKLHGDTVFVDPAADYTFYHFTKERLELLFKGFSLIKYIEQPARSMNGSLRKAFQLIVKQGLEQHISLT